MRSKLSRALGVLLLVHVIAIASMATYYATLEEMVAAADKLLELGTIEQFASRWQRFSIAADAEGAALEYGAYGEFPVRSMAEILQHELVRAAATQSEAATFVDFGSGAGRLVLAVAAMHEWGSVLGIEAMEQLHNIADMATRVAEQHGALREGVARSLHSGDALPHEAPVAEAMGLADITFLYSTAFPSEDGLRLPQLSASLACALREGSLVITADKWLVGERFLFEDLLTVRGENDEPIHAHIWRVVGKPSGRGQRCFDAAVSDIEERWSGEDACADNEAACHALLHALGEAPEGGPSLGDEVEALYTGQPEL